MELEIIKESIHIIRGQRVMLDSKLAELYGVETRVLNQAVRRNMDRFPSDFMIQLTESEFNPLRSQIVTLENGNKSLTSQIVISNRGGTRHLPYAFTEQGVAMLSSVLRSPNAVKVNIAIMRAFVLLRQNLHDYKDLKSEIALLEADMNLKFKDIHEALNYLLSPAAERQHTGYKEFDK